MHLAQHHFQAQSRYFEESIAFTLSHLFHKPYGLIGCDFDAEALHNGIVSLVHARGVMPDGLAFHFPDADDLPERLDVRDLFSPTETSHLVLLTIAPHRSGHANCAVSSEGSASDLRFVTERRMVVDETTGQDEKGVELGRKNFRLALDCEDVGEAVSLPVARVQRDGTGHFIYDPEYVPPCLQIGASQHLLTLTGRIVDALEAKSAALAGERAAEKKPLAEYASHEVANFWLSHTIHSSLAPLRHHLETRRSSPEQLYRELVRLGGALCTFTLDAHPRDLPLYDHDDLTECFNRVDQHIRANLDVVVPGNAVSIPLERSRQYLFVGTVTDRRCFGNAQWLLGIRSSARSTEVIASTPRLVKVCSAKHILRLVKEGLAGLSLDHVPSPPAAVSARRDTQYFVIGKSGPCWDSTVKTGEVGIYVPDALPGAELELLVILS